MRKNNFKLYGVLLSLGIFLLFTLSFINLKERKKTTQDNTKSEDKPVLIKDGDKEEQIFPKEEDTIEIINEIPTNINIGNTSQGLMDTSIKEKNNTQNAKEEMKEHEKQNNTQTKTYLALDKKISGSNNELIINNEQNEVLQIIHQLSWSAQKIHTYNDVIVLDEEQHTISSDSLDLSKFKDDEDLYKTVKELRDLIFKFQEAEIEKIALEEFRRDEQIIDIIESANIFKGINPEKYIRDSLKSPKIQVSDPYSELAVIGSKLLINMGDSIANYILIRKKMELKLKKEKFELDKKKREELHKSLQDFDVNIKNAIVKKLPRDKELRTTLEHIKKLVDEVKNANLEEFSPETTEKEKKEKVIELSNFFSRNQRYYNYFPMYWYYRGICEEKLGHSDEAIKAYKRYQELDISLIKWNKISASVAMNITRLLLDKNGDYKNEIYSQLEILDSNTNLDEENWNYPYFAGLVYLHKFGDFIQATRELKIAEEKSSRIFRNEWKAFQESLKNEGEIKIPAPAPNDPKNICAKTNIIPSAHNLYLCRLALNNAKMLEAGEDLPKQNQLKEELLELANKETTSIFEGLNYFGSTNSSAFLIKYLKDLASIKVSVNYEVGTDELIVTLPLKLMLLKEVYPTLHLYSFNDNTKKFESSKVKSLIYEKEVSKRRNDGFIEKKIEKCLHTKLYDRYEDRMLTPGQKVKMIYDVEIDEMKDAQVEYIELRIPHGDKQYISVLFDIDDIFTKNIVDPFMFARAVIYEGKLYKLFGNVVATDPDDTFDSCRGGGTWWDSIQRCMGWRVQSLKWPGGNVRIVDNLNRVRISFPKDSEGAMNIKDHHWKDICEQLRKGNFYWNEWLKNNPPITLTNDNKDIIIHGIFLKTKI